MEHTTLAERIAAALLDCSLCLHCLAIKTSVTPQDVMAALPTITNALSLRVDALAPCEACNSRRGVTYSFARVA